jgi:hypothetical protein
MNKTVVGLIVGLVLGAGSMWLGLHRSADAERGAGAPLAPSAPEKPKENPLHLPPAKRAAVGIKLAKPAAVTTASEVTAYGRVLDPASLLAGVAELTTARAALTATEKEAERAKKLFAAGGNASAQAVELAEANLARDRAAAAAAQGRLAVNWGRGVADHLEAVATALEHGAALARLDVLPGEKPAAQPATAQIFPPGSDESLQAEILGPAAVADPQVQGPSFLALLRDRTLPAGAAVRALLPGAGDAAHALAVPRGAVVYHQGSAWVFVLGEEDTFERKLVMPGRAVGDGLAITSGLEPDEQIVVAGAQQLLAAELQAGGAAPEE